MFDFDQSWKRDFPIRLAGLGLLACCYAAMRWLLRVTTLRHGGDPSALECLAAATSFLCLSGGAVLAMLGGHVFDRVEVAQRWAHKVALVPIGTAVACPRTPDVGQER